MKIYKLKQFAKYQIRDIDDCKNFLKEDLETLSNLTCFFIIEDLKNQELIDGMFFDFGKIIESIKKENIKNKITYNNEEKLKEKEILDNVKNEFDKFIQDNINFYLRNDFYKIHIFKIPNDEKDKKKLENIINTLSAIPSNELTNGLVKIYDVLYIRHPLKTLTIIVFIIFLYIVTTLILKNFTLNDIDSNDIMLSIYIILIFVSAVYVFLGIILFSVGYLITKYYRGTKAFIGAISLVIIIVGIFITFKNFYALLNSKKLSEIFLANPIINLYIQSKGYPKFAVLHTKKGDKLEFIRYVNNGFIYYQNICDINYTAIKKLKSHKKFLDVVDFYNEIYNKVLYAINVREVKELRRIRTGIPFELFYSYYKKQCKSRKNKE